MNYKVGDTVVCIDATPTKPGHTIVKAGERYRVRAFGKTCCGQIVVDVGAVSQTGTTQCDKCDGEFIGSWSLPWRFIKLDGLEAETGTVATKRNQQVIPEVL